MKKLLTLVLCASMLILASCAKSEPTQYGFVDKNTEIEYVDCKPMGLYPINEGEEYISVKEDKSSTVYYIVENEEPSRFLCYKDENNLFLVRSKDIEEPTAESFNPVAAQVYNSTNMLLIDMFYANFEYIPDEYLEDVDSREDFGETELVKQISAALKDGEMQNPAISSETISEQYYFHLLSPDFPGLYYLVSFFKFEGRYYLRDGAAGKTVFCPYDVIVRMVGEDDV